MSEGRPLEIITVVETSDEESTMFLNTENLESVLCSPQCKDKPVVVISVAGVCRTGKSFLLNYIMQCLQWYEKNDSGTWKPDENLILSGFEWKHSYAGVTSGMMMWSKPLLIQIGQEKMAVLLVDTEGGDDPDKNPEIYTHLITLSSLMSSCQIINIRERILRSNLDCLSLTVEYGKLSQSKASADSSFATFQNLTFIIRDWIHGDFGLKAGAAQLTRLFKQLHNADSVKTAFTSMNCFLMPYPGEVVKKKDFDGRLHVCDYEFKEQLPILMSHMMSQLSAKLIEGKRVTGSQLATYFETFFNIFKHDMPMPTQVLEATALVHLDRLLVDCRTLYSESVKKALASDPAMNDASLLRQHEFSKAEALTRYDKDYKMGQEILIVKKREELLTDISNAYTALQNSHYRDRQDALSAVENFVNAVVKGYIHRMNTVFNGEPGMDVTEVNKLHEKEHSLSLREYDSKAEGIESDVKEGLERLKFQLMEAFKSLKDEQFVRRETLYKRLFQLVNKHAGLYVDEMRKHLTTSEDTADFHQIHEQEKSSAINALRNEIAGHSESVRSRCVAELQSEISKSYGMLRGEHEFEIQKRMSAQREEEYRRINAEKDEKIKKVLISHAEQSEKHRQQTEEMHRKFEEAQREEVKRRQVQEAEIRRQMEMKDAQQKELMDQMTSMKLESDRRLSELQSTQYASGTKLSGRCGACGQIHDFHVI